MKLKTTKVGADKHEENVRRGKNAKRKGGQYERDIAKKFQKRYGVELKRTPQSGGFAKKSEKADDYRGDITIVDTKQMLLIHIECKAHKTLALQEWIRQAEEDCPEGRLPIVVFHEHGTSNDFICMRYFDLLCIATKVKKSFVVEKPEVEEWKEISSFPDYYVSNCGRVKSFRPHNGKIPKEEVKELILSKGVDSQGYEIVVLRKNNKGYSKRVHHLVAKEFLSIEGLVNHIDGNKLHNWSTNLEKSSYSSNLQHAYDTGLHKKGEEHYLAKLTDTNVAEIRLLVNRGIALESIANEFNVSETTIKRIKNNPDYRNPQNLFFDFKSQKKWSVLKWFHTHEKECAEDKIPCLVLDGEVPYSILNLEDFFKLVEKDKVIGKRVFK